MASFFNTNLKYIRSIKGISQKQLAEKIGVDQSTISYWEKGMDVTVDNAIKVAEILNVPIPDFLGRDLRIKNDIENKQTLNFGDVEVTLSKDGEITNEDILEIQQFLMQEKIKNDNDR